MDDTDTSHLQSPDAALPASSLANDLKIPLTRSNGLTGPARRVPRRAIWERKRRRNARERIEYPFVILGRLGQEGGGRDHHTGAGDARAQARGTRV